MINTIVSEILGMVLPSILDFAYSYLIISLLILIILPIIILIATLSLSMSNKAKIFILIFNIFYSFLLLPTIYLLLLSIIQNYETILNNIYMTSYFSIFSLILAEIYRNIGSFIVIYVVISIIMIILYRLNLIPNLKEYINNKRFLIIASLISLVSGFLLPWLISTTNSIKPIHYFFLCTLLTATIVYYYSTKKIRKINIKNIKDLFEVLVAWSFLLGLMFLSIKENVLYILKFFPMSYELILYFITSLIIFFIVLTVYLYIYADDTHKNIIKWYILAFYSSTLLPIYLIAKGSILYIIMGDQLGIIINIVGFLILAIFLRIFFYFHSNVMKNVNKKISNDFWDTLLLIFAILSTAISLFIEELLFCMAIAYAILIIILLLIAIKYINKNEGVMNDNLMSKNY